MDREDSLRALSQYSNEKVRIHCSHKRHLSDSCVQSLTSPKAGSRQQKKELKKNHYAATGKQRREVHLEHLQKVKRKNPGNSCWHKDTGWRRSQGSHPVSWQGGVAVQSLLETRKQGSADGRRKTGTSTTCSASNNTPILVVSLSKVTALLACSPNNLF